MTDKLKKAMKQLYEFKESMSYSFYEATISDIEKSKLAQIKADLENGLEEWINVINAASEAYNTLKINNRKLRKIAKSLTKLKNKIDKVDVDCLFIEENITKFISDINNNVKVDKIADVLKNRLLAQLNKISYALTLEESKKISNARKTINNKNSSPSELNDAYKAVKEIAQQDKFGKLIEDASDLENRDQKMLNKLGNAIEKLNPNSKSYDNDLKKLKLRFNELRKKAGSISDYQLKIIKNNIKNIIIARNGDYLNNLLGATKKTKKKLANIYRNINSTNSFKQSKSEVDELLNTRAEKLAGSKPKSVKEYSDFIKDLKHIDEQLLGKPKARNIYLPFEEATKYLISGSPVMIPSYLIDLQQRMSRANNTTSSSETLSSGRSR